MAESNQQNQSVDRGNRKMRAIAKRGKDRNLRSRSYSMQMLQIGTFNHDTTNSTNACSNKIRFYFNQRQMIYDFDFEFWVNPEAPSKFLAAISVSFDSIIGICCTPRDLYFVVNTAPQLIIGSNGLHTAAPPIGIDITNGQLASDFCHRITLARSQGDAVRQQLINFDEKFKRLQFDVTPLHMIPRLDYGATSTNSRDSERTETAVDENEEVNGVDESDGEVDEIID